MTITPPQNGHATTRRDAWPEYKGKDAQYVHNQLKKEGNNVFIQAPSPKIPRPSPGDEQDFNDDVWLYTDKNNQVVIIPKRGPHHESPVSGWEELVGTGLEKSVQTILDQVIGVEVVYGAGTFGVAKEYDPNRVIVRFDEELNVVTPAPKLG